MGFFGMLFWALVLWLVVRALRRSERCVAVRPRGYWADGVGRERYETTVVPRAGVRPADRQDYIDSLESRISEMEERLDFTERLLASRAEK
jgi:hypothetical protein